MNTLAYVAIGAVHGLLGAVVVDLQAWHASRKVDRHARFDLAVAIPRWLAGAAAGASSGLLLSFPALGSFGGN